MRERLSFVDEKRKRERGRRCGIVRRMLEGSIVVSGVSGFSSILNQGKAILISPPHPVVASTHVILRTTCGARMIIQPLLGNGGKKKVDHHKQVPTQILCSYVLHV